MNSRKERAIIVKYNDEIIKFQECRGGLYCYDTTNKFISHVNYYYLSSTVKYEKEYFSTSEIQGVDKARKVQNWKLFVQELLISRTWSISNF